MRTLVCALGLASAALVAPAHADPAATLREFVRDVKSGTATFTQTVTSPDGARRKTSTGSFEFARPNRFRFAYQKPFEQVIVADGQKVWIHDADLNQVSTRKLGAALGATPAALLAGGSLDGDFEISNAPPADGLEWAEAKPKAKDDAFQFFRVGFRGKDLAALEIVDSFGQRSLLRFGNFVANAPVPAERFRFTVPAGADVIEQP
ncbi:outer membrane lipoprotein chaperone LolA [Piscinibacter koreensis]|uniref:Outer-membrane lipoprotein carrier protein n=1 Tax=Piscinibacter koreensis TaxID=2742824 RepID=A0A7Y6NLT9_9BURK|nr:outer membrane lipoprotein chaperone LolA [Schlegelella koreensis]NUZ05474.1 outer membrane lipoprotein chaperone LolA [Schlegelella koreensis]